MSPWPSQRFGLECLLRISNLRRERRFRRYGEERALSPNGRRVHFLWLFFCFAQNSVSRMLSIGSHCLLFRKTIRHHEAISLPLANRGSKSNLFKAHTDKFTCLSLAIVHKWNRSKNTYKRSCLFVFCPKKKPLKECRLWETGTQCGGGLIVVEASYYFIKVLVNKTMFSSTHLLSGSTTTIQSF